MLVIAKRAFRFKRRGADVVIPPSPRAQQLVDEVVGDRMFQLGVQDGSLTVVDSTPLTAAELGPGVAAKLATQLAKVQPIPAPAVTRPPFAPRARPRPSAGASVVMLPASSPAQPVALVRESGQVLRAGANPEVAPLTPQPRPVASEPPGGSNYPAQGEATPLDAPVTRRRDRRRG